MKIRTFIEMVEFFKLLRLVKIRVVNRVSLAIGEFFVPSSE